MSREKLKIELVGEELERYMEVRRMKMQKMMPDGRTLSRKQKIKFSRLTPRQKKKMVEMSLEERGSG